MSNTNRSVAIIGAGQTGVSAAVGFLNAGFDVTVYSERDQRSLLHDVSATGTAVTFGLSQQSETALGVDNFAGRAPQVTGISARTITGSGHDYTELSTSTPSSPDSRRSVSTPGSRSTSVSPCSSKRVVASWSRTSIRPASTPSQRRTT